MKRLQKKADYYNEYQDNSKDGLQQLKESAEEFCNIFGINKNTISIDTLGSSAAVTFGNIEEDGFEVTVDVYNINTDQRINRIILSAGKNSKGKSMYVETREQSILDAFFNKNNEFYDWMDQSIGNIESRF